MISKIFFILVSCFLVMACKKSHNIIYDDNVILYEDKTPEFMRNKTSMPLDENSKAIYFYTRSGGLQDLTRVFRLECDADKIDAIIQKFIDKNNKQIGYVAEREEIKKEPFHRDMAPSEETSKLSWWNLNSAKIIRANLCREGFGLSYWVTEDDNKKITIYFYQSS